MNPILVIVHIYYPEIWNEIKEYLKNILTPYDLYVTTIQENNFLQSDIKMFKENSFFEIVENRGYDIGPFVHIINKINLDNYSYVVKLHTKRNLPIGCFLNGYDVSLNKWRKYALSFLQKKYFSKCLAKFKNNSSLGMISDFRLIVNKEAFDFDALQKAKQLCKINDNINIKYVAGTMFICRSLCLKPLQTLNLQLSDFPRPDKEHSSQLAHVIERYIGISIYYQDFIIKDVYTNLIYKILYIKQFHKFKHFVFQFKITKSGKKIIKICKIPIYWRKIK